MAAATRDATADSPPRPSVLDTLGEEVVRIVAPVSACMLLVVLLTAALSSNDPSSSLLPTIPATSSSSSSSSSSSWFDQLRDALLSSFAFVALLTALTFLLLLLFYFRCTAFLRYYMAFSSSLVLAFMGGAVSLLLLRRFDLPLDCPTFLVLLLNFAVVGGVAVLGAAPIALTQGYLVLIGVLVAYSFTMLPEWTTWALLVAMAVYDLAAVLLPVGPLRLLVELAISRDEEIPALVYEARPVVGNAHHRGAPPTAPPRRRLWRERRESMVSDPNSDSNLNGSSGLGVSQLREEEEARLVSVEEGRAGETSVAALTVPLIERQLEGARHTQQDVDGIGLGSSGAIKLGLGDFIFYSVLVGRAAMYDFMTVYACYLAIIAGLGVTLLLLAIYRKALPALPVSIALGLVFYFLTRMLLEVFVVQCSLNLVMF